MRKSPYLNELNRLAPAFARRMRYDLLFFQEVIQGVAGETSIPAGVRKKLEDISGHFGNIAQRATQFIQITDSNYKVAINARDCIRNLKSPLRRILGSHKLQIDIADDLWQIQAVSEAQFEEILLIL